MEKLQPLPEAIALARHQPQRVALFADRDQPQSACAGDLRRFLARLGVDVEHGGLARLQQLGEQAHLGAEIVGEVGVVVEMVAGDVGEAAGRDLHAVEAELVEAVAGGFEREVLDAVLLELRQQAVDFDRIGRGVAERNLAVRRDDADSAQARGRLTERGPDLADEGDDGGFALGAGDGGDGLRLRAEEARGVAREAEQKLGGLGPLTPEEVGALIANAFIGAESLFLLGLEKRGLPVRQALRRVGDLIRMAETRPEAR